MSGISRDRFDELRREVRVAEAKADEALSAAVKLAKGVDTLAAWAGTFERVSVWRRIMWVLTGR